MPHDDEASALTLADVLERLGPSLVSVAAATGPGLNRPVSGVVIHDPLLQLEPGAAQVLLAVGVDPTTHAASELLAAAAANGFAAVVVHSDAPLPGDLLDVARTVGMAVLVAPQDVSWLHLAALLRVSLAPQHSDALAGIALGDLFGFAGALATQVRGAVTIEDPQSRVLAYSSVEGDVDEPRKETILGRQVPQRYTRLLQEKGVFRQLAVSDDVVHMDAVPSVGLRRRIAISVRAAGELLGSIWVAEAGGPLAPSADDVLREAATTAALHIIRHRTEQHGEATLRQELIRELIEGREAPDLVALRLGIEPDCPYVVVAFEVPLGGTPSRRLLRAVELYCSTFNRRALAVDVGPRVYVVLPWSAEGGHAAVRRFVADGARRAGGAVRARVVGAIGGHAPSAHLIPGSRAEADRVMRVLLRSDGGVVVADLDDVRAHANLLELVDVLRERPHLQAGKLDRLLSQPGERRHVLVDTLAAFLDHAGDVPRAARDLQVHPNTFRYRLDRAFQLTGLRLDDPAERLMTALQMKLLGSRSTSPSPPASSSP